MHERRGPHEATNCTPPRRVLSVRRTTTHDSLRPNGLLGEVHQVARGRDLRTARDGGATVVEEAQLELVLGPLPDYAVAAIVADPPADGLDRLIGIRAGGGFRRAVDEALPGERDSRSLRFQLLDDVPTAALVSGHAVPAGGVQPEREQLRPTPDLCAGWQSGATIMNEIRATGHPPVVTGPLAPPLERPDDELAWHEADDLPPHGMRRRRRLDVWRQSDGSGDAAVEAFLRDSHMSGDGVERVVHEYTVRARMDVRLERFTACEAFVGVLPWAECPMALASATRLVGESASGLRERVRDTFRGPSTCTHLNDVLRSLEDVPALLDALHERNR